jgi:LacI family transcriptional regulator
MIELAGVAVANTPSNPPTLREIARLAGVSHTTVSLSLRNDPSIPEPTRARVRALADDMGYRSNVLVSALMSQVRLKQPRSAPVVVAFLTGGPTADEWRNHSANVGFFEGARKRAAALGMKVEPYWLGPGGSAAASTCRMLYARAIRAVLITPFAVPVYAHELDWDRFCCVGLGYVYGDHPLHRTTHNHFRGVFRAFETLHKRGYRRIGLMLETEQNSRVSYSWLGGFLAAQNTLGAAALEPLLTTPQNRLQKVRQWLRSQKPDAVIGFGPVQYAALRETGLRIPDDIAFAALDVEQTRLAHVEDVSGINQNLELIGSTAVDILASQLYHNEQGLSAHPVLSMIEGHWVDGRTAPVVAPTGRS